MIHDPGSICRLSRFVNSTLSFANFVGVVLDRILMLICQNGISLEKQSPLNRKISGALFLFEKNAMDEHKI